MLGAIQLDPQSETPLYRQLYEVIKLQILKGRISRGEKLPAGRELAGTIGLHRTTIAAAYELLEAEGLIKSHVGRGTFVEAEPETRAVRESEVISFAASRPSEDEFPLNGIRATCREVLESAEAASILQLGSASGYGPLRRFVLNEVRKRGAAGPDDDILITSGCQQAFDLIQRVMASRGETVLMEDPVYPGVRNVFQRGGAKVIGIPVGEEGIDLHALERTLEKERVRLIVLTPNFQNPTGTTIPEFERGRIIEMARRAGARIVENDLYGALRYAGSEVPAFKELDKSGETIVLGSFSKIAFPGLRVGWAIGPRALIAELTEAKEACDLHSDQLSQAVLLRFAESGRLKEHHEKTIETGAERLKACLEGCARELPKGSRYTRPQGGMNVWVTLPEPMEATDLAARAAAEGVNFLPGRYFAVSRPQTNSLRLSFAGLRPADIARGWNILGRIFRTEYERARRGYRHEPSPALV
ncbi:MAG TPA: PLP-dependent aminotransferase family protein [Bryobacteraceae bacterium]|nr:PLP-dependent aminotransferase family protein [Bryobacteraceae bacterium]